MLVGFHTSRARRRNQPILDRPDARTTRTITVEGDADVGTLDDAVDEAGYGASA
ncbi:hypothetical protein [Halorientalis pallida]|uniref:hypothetical protein n=1 Tax=Halorientalis pallida TaxID=2479928 RepID=UPI00187D4D4C|nr:hypothetical protein [Halorientalis pallida]